MNILLMVLGSIFMVLYIIIDWYSFDKGLIHLNTQYTAEEQPDDGLLYQATYDEFGKADFSKWIEENCEVSEKTNTTFQEPQTNFQSSSAVTSLIAGSPQKDLLAELEKELEKTEMDKGEILRNRLTGLAECGDDLEAIIQTQYQLYEVEGKYKSMDDLKGQFPEYFTPAIPSPVVLDEDVPPVITECIPEHSFAEEGSMQLKQLNPSDYILNINSEEDTSLLDIDLPVCHQHRSTAQIAQNLEGTQVWYGRVIGIQERFIHFRDLSKRKWLKVGKRARFLSNGDLLLVHVNRKGNLVSVVKIVRVEEAAANSMQMIG
ncbi:hypothetical protein LCY76_23645 [Fictibacillus sp. KIGAM418]|uniref:Uncharacterized protein n=1 Tax=Fictibacillus marinisediminis TaxID=2878389 RepID=A0A9X1XEP7_9BACL|nr:hypothetical protein [Fictibacillus marinisediminis]MCK6259567.1 hypothetical protein [Fictibacillus marinisediminis]